MRRKQCARQALAMRTVSSDRKQSYSQKARFLKWPWSGLFSLGMRPACPWVSPKLNQEKTNKGPQCPLRVGLESSDTHQGWALPHRQSIRWREWGAPREHDALPAAASLPLHAHYTPVHGSCRCTGCHVGPERHTSGEHAVEEGCATISAVHWSGLSDVFSLTHFN